MKASDIEDLGENEVTVPIVSKRVSPISIGSSSILGTKLGGKVKPSEIAIEKRRSNDRFKELMINGTKVYLLNSKGEIVETTSKMCGDDEYMFMAMEGKVRIWKGGVSVFENGEVDILFHKPHMVIDFKEDGFPVVSDIHNFDIISFMRILDAIGVIDKIFGKGE